MKPKSSRFKNVWYKKQLKIEIRIKIDVFFIVGLKNERKWQEI